jgi:AcrR family transcriptional regulator
MRLFAAQGFRGTTVGEIEAAAGLAPRAGGLYKHFRSKEEVLEAGIEQQVAAIEATRPALEMLPLGDVRAELTLAGWWGLHLLADEQPLMKIVQKDGDQFPELVAKVHERIIARGHLEARTLIGRMLAEAGLDEDEAAALGAVALGSLVGYRVEEAMFGPRPVSAEEFLETWVDVWTVYAERRAAERPALATKAR